MDGRTFRLEGALEDGLGELEDELEEELEDELEELEKLEELEEDVGGDVVVFSDNKHFISGEAKVYTYMMQQRGIA